MTAVVTIADRLPELVREAARQLSAAMTSAEVLAARETAGVVYDQAKRAARLAKTVGAHDRLVGTIHRVQADALEIESLAKRRLADEYDAAQERGEVAGQGQRRNISNGNVSATAADVGLSGKQIYESRQIRDAIREDPGIVRRALDEMMASGDEPTRSALKRELGMARANLRAAVGTASATNAERGNNLYETPVEAMRVLLALESFNAVPGIYEPACGKGAILRVLEDAGYDVAISDLVDYGTATQHGECQGVFDFLASKGATGRDIVTNPPYGTVLNGFVAHALREYRPRKMALLLNLNFLCGFDDPDRCFAMDENPPARIIVFTRRLPMMHRDGWDGPEAQSRMNTAWFVWEMDAVGNYSGPATVHRVDWKDFENAAPLGPTDHRIEGERTGPETALAAQAVDESAVINSWEQTSSPVPAIETGAAPPPAAPALLVWDQPHAGGRLVAKLGEIEVGAVFPNEDKGCTWSFWLGSAHGPQKSAKSIEAAKAAITKLFAARTGLAVAA